MNEILNFIGQYWGLGATFAGGLIYYLTHRSIATAYAKKVIIKLMLSAEKKAEELILATGQEKMNWVIDKGYNLLPAPVRLFVSYSAFKSIAQFLYDEAIKFAQSHQVMPTPAPVPAPVVDPTPLPVVPQSANSSDHL